MPHIPAPHRLLTALVLAVALGAGCTVERAEDTEACIEERMAEGLSAPEAHAECAEEQTDEAQDG